VGVRWCLTVVALSVVVAAELAATGHGRLETVTDAMAGAAFLAVGVAQWAGSRRHAVLAYGAGLAWFAGAVMPAVLWAHRPLMLHATLGFPEGRLPSRAARVVVAAAWPVALIPTLARDALLTLLLSIAAAAVAWTSVRGAPPARRRTVTTAAWATTLVSAGMALPATDRLVPPDLPDPLSPAVAYAALLAFAGLVLLVGRPQPQRGADAVIELTQHDPAQALAALRQEARAQDDPASRATLDGAVELLEANLALHAELAAKVSEVRASRRRLVVAALRERRRLERQLSGGAVRYLDELADVLGDLASSEDARVAELARRGADEVSRTRDDLRQLARGLHPRTLSERGLAGALSELARGSPVRTTAAVPERRFPDLVETAVWYACAEAMANLVKHSAATSASIHVQADEHELTVRVSDDGVGGAAEVAQGGLAGLTDRLGAVDGRLDVRSPAGGGTVLTIQVPLP
jgi:signal transduction histidine kinase